MKKITIHGYVQDNAGTYHPKGADLTVDDKGGEGCVTEDAAKALVASHCASAHKHAPAAHA